MTTFRNGKISKDNIVRADGFTDRERANEFDLGNKPVGSDPSANGFFNGKDPFVNGVKDFFNPSELAKSIRSKNAPVDGIGNVQKAKESAPAGFKKSTEQDWRVKLSIPTIEPFKSSALLAPLRHTGGLVFPYTPSIIVSHSANYNAIAPTHTNYPYYAYQNSQVDQLVITGDFFVQNGLEAQYWVAALHYLRSMSKMFFGGEADTIGAPPPIAKLNGYGDHIFNNVPVIVTQFTTDLPQDVDYIATGFSTGKEQKRQVGPQGRYTETYSDGKLMTGWAPTQSLITVTVQPVYSRSEIAQFSLNKYVNGGYIADGKGFI
tara:strand:- start:9456 stop:10412 length:957 start_codon:yes stop_codon:yes gene_type:complete